MTAGSICPEKLVMKQPSLCCQLEEYLEQKRERLLINGYFAIVTHIPSLLPVLQTPNLMNSTRLHKVFQNFVVPWKIYIYINI